MKRRAFLRLAAPVDASRAGAGQGSLRRAEGRIADRALTRRVAAALSGFVGLGLACAITRVVADPADERPREGDQLVAADGAGSTALTPGDVPASPMLAWPMEPGSNLVRSGSRLNKVVLVRLDPAALKEQTESRAADGAVAYSAICPHAGCEVNGWVAEQSILECPCHNSRYDPSNAAAIVDGPTTRSLAALPLRIADGKLVVAGPFVGRLGIAPA
jgi:Rieske Fe-S protein